MIYAEILLKSRTSLVFSYFFPLKLQFNRQACETNKLRLSKDTDRLIMINVVYPKTMDLQDEILVIENVYFEEL